MRWTARLALASLGLVPLGGIAQAQAVERETSRCIQTAECWVGKFAFINFTGQRVEFRVDGVLVLDNALQTDDWSTALSRYLEHPLRASSAMELIIDGETVYAGPVSDAAVRTIYIDARRTLPVHQTNHPSPLLD